jgi:hypothetical protein
MSSTYTPFIRGLFEEYRGAAYLLHKTVAQNRGKGLSLDWRLFRIQMAHRAICNSTFWLMFRIKRKSQHFKTGKGCFLCQMPEEHTDIEIGCKGDQRSLAPAPLQGLSFASGVLEILPCMDFRAFVTLREIFLSTVRYYESVG